MKKLLTALLVLALMLGTCTVFAVTDGKAENDAFDLSNYFSDRDLAGTWEESGAVVVDLNGESGAVSLAEAGTYVLSGTLNGSVQVSVDSKDKVQLVLAGVNIASENAAAIYVENADKTFITLAADTENILTSTGFEEDNDIDAAIFSRDDLVLNGAGSLSVVSDKNGIVGKDDLKITGGSYTLTTAGRGIDGNDSVRIADGSFVITSGKDAIRSKNEEEGKGYVLIAGGTFDLTVGGGAENAAPHADDMMGFGRGGWGWGGNAAPADEENTASTKGIKAANSLTILDGTFSFNTADDALHTNGDLTVNGGSLILAAGDDGLHADGALTINDGDLTITQSYEGVEGTAITVNGGTVSLRAADDGLNAAGGNDASGFGTLYNIISWTPFINSEDPDTRILVATLLFTVFLLLTALYLHLQANRLGRK